MTQNEPPDAFPASLPSDDPIEGANLAHLRFVETWTNQIGTTIHGVDVVRCMGYELIQLLNHAAREASRA